MRKVPESLDELFGEGRCTKSCPEVTCIDEKLSLDPWKNKYQFDPKAMVVRSLGRDGESGGKGFDRDIEIEVKDVEALCN